MQCGFSSPRQFKLAKLDILGLKLYTETKVSGGGVSISTGLSGGIVGGGTPITTNCTTYQQLRCSHHGAPEKGELMLKIAVDTMAVAEGQILGVVSEEVGDRNIQIGYVNCSTRAYCQTASRGDGGKSMLSYFLIFGVFVVINAIIMGLSDRESITRAICELAWIVFPFLFVFVFINEGSRRQEIAAKASALDRAVLNTVFCAYSGGYIDPILVQPDGSSDIK
jgi:hypothetical protein